MTLQLDARQHAARWSQLVERSDEYLCTGGAYQKQAGAFLVDSTLRICFSSSLPFSSSSFALPFLPSSFSFYSYPSLPIRSLPSLHWGLKAEVQVEDGGLMISPSDFLNYYAILCILEHFGNKPTDLLLCSFHFPLNLHLNIFCHC